MSNHLSELTDEIENILVESPAGRITKIMKKYPSHLKYTCGIIIIEKDVVAELEKIADKQNVLLRDLIVKILNEYVGKIKE